MNNGSRFPTILQKIEESPYISFEQYFQCYVMAVQDRLIDEELRFFVNNNFLSANAIEKLLNSKNGVLL